MTTCSSHCAPDAAVPDAAAPKGGSGIQEEAAAPAAAGHPGQLGARQVALLQVLHHLLHPQIVRTTAKRHTYVGLVCHCKQYRFVKGAVWLPFICPSITHPVDSAPSSQVQRPVPGPGQRLGTGPSTSTRYHDRAPGAGPDRCHTGSGGVSNRCPRGQSGGNAVCCVVACESGRCRCRGRLRTASEAVRQRKPQSKPAAARGAVSRCTTSGAAAAAAATSAPSRAAVAGKVSKVPAQVTAHQRRKSLPRDQHRVSFSSLDFLHV